MQQYLYNGSESRQDKKKEKTSKNKVLNVLNEVQVHKTLTQFLLVLKMSSQKLVLFCSYIKCGYYGTLFWHLPKLLFRLKIVQQANLKLERWKAPTDAPTLDSVEFLNPVNGKLIWGVHYTSQWV